MHTQLNTLQTYSLHKLAFVVSTLSQCPSKRVMFLLLWFEQCKSRGRMSYILVFRLGRTGLIQSAHSLQTDSQTTRWSYFEWLAQTNEIVWYFVISLRTHAHRWQHYLRPALSAWCSNYVPIIWWCLQLCNAPHCGQASRFSICRCGCLSSLMLHHIWPAKNLLAGTKLRNGPLINRYETQVWAACLVCACFVRWNREEGKRANASARAARICKNKTLAILKINIHSLAPFNYPHFPASGFCKDPQHWT